MDEYLSRRATNRSFRFSQVNLPSKSAITPWYASNNLQSAPTKQDQLTVSRHLASAGIVKKQHSFAAKSRNKRRPKVDGDGSESYSSSSESDGDGNRRSKKSKNRCWKGYEPTPGKAPYSDGSCQKA